MFRFVSGAKLLRNVSLLFRLCTATTFYPKLPNLAILPPLILKHLPQRASILRKSLQHRNYMEFFETVVYPTQLSSTPISPLPASLTRGAFPVVRSWRTRGPLSSRPAPLHARRGPLHARTFHSPSPQECLAVPSNVGIRFSQPVATQASKLHTNAMTECVARAELNETNLVLFLSY